MLYRNPQIGTETNIQQERCYTVIHKSVLKKISRTSIKRNKCYTVFPIPKSVLKQTSTFKERERDAVLCSMSLIKRRSKHHRTNSNYACHDQIQSNSHHSPSTLDPNHNQFHK